MAPQSAHLTRLNHLASLLPALSEFATRNADGTILYGDKDSGPPTSGTGIYNNGAIAVQIWEADVGTTFPSHNHTPPIEEWGIFWKGRATLHLNNESIECGPNSVVHFRPHDLHSWEVHEPVSAVFITRPADPGYPE